MNCGASGFDLWCLGMEEPVAQAPQNNCRNCGAPLRGEYCHHCGQREGRGDLRFIDVVGDVLGDAVTWDSRFWRTLVPLVFRPGFLAAEFIAGRRARYMPPFRLYIVVSFLLFLVISLTARDMVDIGEDPEGITVTSVTETADPNDIAETEAALAEAQERLDELGIPVDVTQHAPGAAEEDNALVFAPVVVGDDDDDGDAVESESEEGESDGIHIGLADPNSPVWLQELDERIETNAESLREDPRQFIELMLDYLPQMMFLMLPVFALLLKFCYLLSPFHYLQHLVFSLHYHSFVYILYLIAEALDRLQYDFGGWLFLALVVYMPLALRRAYSSGIPGALGKSLFLYISYGISLMVGFAGVVILAVALM